MAAGAAAAGGDLGRRITDRRRALGLGLDAVAERAGTCDETSFEVDRIDDSPGAGWSVLLTGDAHVVAARHLREVGIAGVEPWAAGHRPAYVRLRPRVVTGRRIGCGGS